MARARIVVSALLLIATSSAVPAEASAESRAKAAALYNVAKFVEWPPDAFADRRAPVVFCVLGADDLGDALDAALQGHLIGARPAVVKRVSEPAADCHVLFVAEADAKRLPALLDRLGAHGVLTASDAPGFVDQGGVIGLVADAGRVRFDINLAAADRAKLRISARVLLLASSVRKAEASR